MMYQWLHTPKKPSNSFWKDKPTKPLHENKMKVNAASDGNHEGPILPAKLPGALDPYSVSFGIARAVKASSGL